MIEIYKDTSETITLTVTVGGTLTDADTIPTLTITDRNTGTDYTPSVSKVGVGQYEAITPLAISQNPTRLKALWEFTLDGEPVSRTEWIEVVIPYASVDEIKTHCDAVASYDTDKIKEMERRVRNVIDKFCGQDFGYALDKTYNFTGSGDDSLQLHTPLIKLEEVKDENGAVLFDRDTNGDVRTEHVTFYSDSATILRSKHNWPYPDFDPKSDVSPYFRGSPMFKNGRVYIVKGDWGWEYVPNEINQAAILLVGTYFGTTSNYRRNGVWWADTEQFEMRFNQDILNTTGNTDADILLMGHTNHRIVMF